MNLIDRLAKIVGSEYVLTDPAITESYITDWTGRWHGRTCAVVRPASAEEVSGVVKQCANAGVAIVPQGGNTGLVGASVPHDGELVLSLRRLDAIESVDPVERTLGAGAGVTLAAAQRAAASEGLMLGIDLAARDSATLGGVVATNAGGLRVIRHGSTRGQLVGAEVVLGDGSVVRRWSGLAKDNVGYDIPGLLAGSEGTLGIVTKVLLRLTEPPRSVWVAMVGVSSIDDAHAVVAGVRRAGITLEAAEYFHAAGLRLVRDRAGLRGLFGAEYPVYLLAEMSGTTDAALANAFAELGELVGDATIEAGPAKRLWAYRESFPDAVRTAGLTTGTPALKLDVSLPLRRQGTFDAALRELAEQWPGTLVVSFGHLAEGNAHINLIGVPAEAADEAMDAALRLVVDHGGSISAEHGIGRLKRRWLPLQRSAADIAAMRAIKNALDPHGILSPGTLLP
ncbi:MAG TPA: FAD-binding oxidoreductase [Jiangellaceae bacterium]|nr:FAD-binding oxidoreductase [Jiangellaceae bacterium]